MTPPQFLDLHSAIIGISGMGKTVTAKENSI
jgi:type IV secretory pathway VirB4 component